AVTCPVARAHSAPPSSVDCLVGSIGDEVCCDHDIHSLSRGKIEPLSAACDQIGRRGGRLRRPAFSMPESGPLVPAGASEGEAPFSWGLCAPCASQGDADPHDTIPARCPSPSLEAPASP